ncbi:MAG TPA: tRNA (N(6)-L-threonylcarbamoyladenosine(37)-C(2))-methylthiotransferase MtaB [Candidatus Atribacteria bacterium]|nr:tRNA (N(6)-L-threonylcarbamoyladenosine(37)-C(2))-methylthiotransferase MtaB [Candidatus Atribacteria bacterium]
MKIAIKTLGCKVNQSESDVLAALLINEDISLVAFEDQADWYIINSCAVTKMSEKKTRQWISRALRNNEKSQVILIGCYSPLYIRQFPLPQPRLQVIDSPEKIKKVMEILNLPWDESFSSKVTPETERARVWLKIEDGCDHFCNYCIVPHLRGSVRSEEPEKIIRQATHLERKGVQEIVLCGINLGMFGKERENTNLIELLENLVRVTNVVRYRLSSIEPFLIDKEFLDRYFSLIPRACPHFHLPLQSGSDEILLKMGRGYTTQFYRELVSSIRKYDNEVAISTDIIVGFPGESEKLFTETVEFCQEIGFSRAHVFVYSPRPLTPASQWDESEGVPSTIKKDREAKLLKIIRDGQLIYYRSFIGKTLSVLVESVNGNQDVTGYSENYIPVHGDGIEVADYGRIIPVFINREQNGILLGKIIQNRKSVIDSH